MDFSIVDIGNHAKVRAILQQYLSPKFLVEYDAAVRDATIQFIRLSEAMEGYFGRNEKG